MENITEELDQELKDKMSFDYSDLKEITGVEDFEAVVREAIKYYEWLIWQEFLGRKVKSTDEKTGEEFNLCKLIEGKRGVIQKYFSLPKHFEG